ncbi:MAG: cell division protein FtsZ, partial [Rhodobacteraceae bacterium]|nr:cell division protein FtsZ [Paracoccaceae bacterium]
NLFRLANERTTFTEAFAMADDVLYQGVKGVTDLMVRPGLINLDFADVRAVMDEMGKAMMGTGEASGDDRAVQAAEKAIANPLLDEISLHGAKGVLINITGGTDLTLFELDEAANIIREKVDPDANIIVGSTLDPSMQGAIRVSVVATGIDVSQVKADLPVARRSMAQPLKPAQSAPEPRHEAPMTLTAPAAPQTYAPAPTLFDEVPAAAFQPAPEPEDVIAADDHLPPPVYRAPAAQQPAPRPSPAAAAAHDADAASFVAPRPRAPGTPSPEALARLQAAVSKSPAAAAQRPAAAAPARAAAPQPAAAKPAEARPRFGIGGLISRMAGGHPETAERPAARTQPPVTSYDDEQDMGADQERIEIPAFLRRQAN